MTVKAILKELEALGSEKVRKHNAKNGAGKNQYGVQRGELRKIAKRLKSDHKLALELWKTKNIDARFLAVLLIKPESLTPKQLDSMVRSESFFWVADWLNSYVVKVHPDREALRLKWMTDEHPMAARAGWNLTSIRVGKDPEGLDLPALLKRLEAEMGAADEAVQWTMNLCLVEIGIHFSKHRKRALAIGEKLAIYRDLPVPKGCTSPYAPVWINKMVSQQMA